LEGSSEKIGGPNKTVEIDKSFRGNICEIWTSTRQCGVSY
jgi:hypothetical protein